MKLIIEDPAGRRVIVPLDADELTVGRDETNHIRLPERNVSRHHCRFFSSSEGTMVEDLQSSNGLWLNGHPITGRQRVGPGDRIGVGDYSIAIEDRPDNVSSPTTPVVNGHAAPSRSPRPPRRKPTPIPKFPGLPPALEVTPGPRGSADARRSRAGAAATDQPRREPGPLPSRELPRLVILTTELAGISLPLPDRLAILGSGPGAELVLAHPSIAPRHCTIEPVVEGGFFVARTEAGLELAVDGAPCQEALLHPGDTIRVGKVMLRLVGSR